MRIVSRLKQALDRFLYGENAWTLIDRLGIFLPNVAGSRVQLIPLTFLAAEQTFPRLQSLVEATRPDRAPVLDVEEFCSTPEGQRAAAELKVLFDRHGSDKANKHNYHFAYGAIVSQLPAAGAILEIGLGTNHEDAVSNMGVAGRPGASVRAFREYLPTTRLVGADVDKRILFEEDGITTAWVDQTDLATFDEIERLGPFDLIIDDGLHAANANVASLLLAVRGALRPGGWLVIEDIFPHTIAIWTVVGALLPKQYRSTIVKTRHCLLFVAQLTPA